MDKRSSIVKFILDDKLVEIDFAKSDSMSPTTTVLKYLRSLPGHKGVKEGCSVGDCGACTVVLGELFEDKILYKAINSCLVFLPALHGKQLITIENLSCNEGDEIILHPVQHHLIQFRGTQCGFCTPGIVMSLFALYKNVDSLSRNDIENALSGNLCRCTGYQSIIKAAEEACEERSDDAFTLNEDKIIEKLKSINKTQEDLLLLQPGTRYVKPADIKSALKYRKDYQEAIIVGGASDLSPSQNRYKAEYKDVIDVSGISELKKCFPDGSGLFIGASVSIEILRTISKESHPALHDILNVFGSMQIRNQATVAGNIASASPIGDLLPVLFVYNATIELQSLEEKRIINIEDFITGYRKTILRTDEIITGIKIPRAPEDEVIRVYKISKRQDLDISTLSAAFRLKLNDNNDIENIMIVYGGMAEVPKRAFRTEKFLKRKSWNREVVEEALPVLYQEFTPISDARSDEEGRRLAARNLLMKFWIETTVRQ